MNTNEPVTPERAAVRSHDLLGIREWQIVIIQFSLLFSPSWVFKEHRASFDHAPPASIFLSKRRCYQLCLAGRAKISWFVLVRPDAKLSMKVFELIVKSFGLSIWRKPYVQLNDV